MLSISYGDFTNITNNFILFTKLSAYKSTFFFYYNLMNWLIYVIVALVILYIVYRIIKPYILNYDTTLLFCGGLGSGKTLNSVKMSLKLLKKNRLKVKLLNFKNKIRHLFFKVPLLTYEEPILYSNIPIRIKKDLFSTPLTTDILTLKSRIREYSVVLIDELPLVVNQFNWNIPEVQGQLNEFIALFRHYVGGYLIVNGQSESEIVKQVRSKLNSYFWCFDFQKFLFFFYRVRILHSQVNENEVSISSDFIEEHTKWTYGLLTRSYDSRAYSNRYKNINLIAPINQYSSDTLKTNKLMSFNKKYKSPCDEKEY